MPGGDKNGCGAKNSCKGARPKLADAFDAGPTNRNKVRAKEASEGGTGNADESAYYDDDADDIDADDDTVAAIKVFDSSKDPGDRAKALKAFIRLAGSSKGT